MLVPARDKTIPLAFKSPLVVVLVSVELLVVDVGETDAGTEAEAPELVAAQGELAPKSARFFSTLASF